MSTDEQALEDEWEEEVEAQPPGLASDYLPAGTTTRTDCQGSVDYLSIRLNRRLSTSS